MSTPRVTLTECCDLIAQLEPRLGRPSYWSVRTLDDVVGVVDSARVVLNDRRTTRLFDPLDVMLVRLWWRISHDSLQPQWVPGAVIAQHRAELREVFRRRLDRALALRGLRAQVLPLDAAAQAPGEWYRLDDVPVGVVEAMRAIRAAKPEVWTGCKLARVRDVDTVPSSQAALCGVM